MWADINGERKKVAWYVCSTYPLAFAAVWIVTCVVYHLSPCCCHERTLSFNLTCASEVINGLLLPVTSAPIEAICTATQYAVYPARRLPRQSLARGTTDSGDEMLLTRRRTSTHTHTFEQRLLTLFQRSVHSRASLVQMRP